MRTMADMPDNTPIITQEMKEKTITEIAKRNTGEKESPIRGIKDIKCPSCGDNTMSYADDLVFDVTRCGERIVIPNLTGLRCSKCNEAAFDASSTKIIDSLYEHLIT